MVPVPFLEAPTNLVPLYLIYDANGLLKGWFLNANPTGTISKPKPTEPSGLSRIRGQGSSEYCRSQTQDAGSYGRRHPLAGTAGTVGWILKGDSKELPACNR